MLTQNFINAALYFAEGATTAQYAFRQTNGSLMSSISLSKTNIFKSWVSGYFANALPPYDNGYKSTIWLGNGSGDFNGYSLKNAVNTFSLSDAVITTSLIDGVSKRVATATCTWSGGDDTITEIGMVAGDSLRIFLMAYKELESPITVHNGDVFTVSMAIG